MVVAQACFLDPALSLATMMRVNPGATGASAVFSWVQSIVKVATLQPQFLRLDAIDRAVNATIAAERTEKDREDEMIQAAQTALAARYVMAELLPSAGCPAGLSLCACPFPSPHLRTV